MRLNAVMNCVAFASMLTLAGAAVAAPDTAPERVSGPLVHDNLAIYFVHGPSRGGAVPLTLAEALSRHLAEVRETGEVNSLQIENLSDQPIFVQAGDIVKGGRQDRTLAVSLLLPPKSGRIPIASFCVESGRWSARGNEDSHAFASAMAAVPSREMKLAIAAPVAAAPASVGSGHLGSVGMAGRVAALDTGSRQGRVWDAVRHMQHRLSASTGADVRAVASQSSLQLALENKKLEKMRAAYVDALEYAGDKGSDIVGYIFAVNGKLNSGDVYMSNALFRKMWPKMLNAAANEAIGQRDAAGGKPPSAKSVREFMAAAEAGKQSEAEVAFGMHRITHAGDKGYMIEAALDGGFVHRSYLAK
jgi:ARG and Rhodanese-Phosphatase-superfamily-associated Protein domain